jgi:hypothetical protein
MSLLYGVYRPIWRGEARGQAWRWGGEPVSDNFCAYYPGRQVEMGVYICSSLNHD